jgi:hypothetical protein
MGNQILVDFRCVRPPVQTPTNLFNNSVVSIGVEWLRGEAAIEGSFSRSRIVALVCTDERVSIFRTSAYVFIGLISAE